MRAKPPGERSGPPTANRIGKHFRASLEHSRRSTQPTHQARGLQLWCLDEDDCASLLHAATLGCCSPTSQAHCFVTLMHKHPRAGAHLQTSTWAQAREVAQACVSHLTIYLDVQHKARACRFSTGKGSCRRCGGQCLVGPALFCLGCKERSTASGPGADASRLDSGP